MSKHNYDISLADAYRDTTASSADDSDDLPGENPPKDDVSDDDLGSEEDTDNLVSSYGHLLQSLNVQPRSSDPATKKRKLLNGSSETAVTSLNIDGTEGKALNDSFSMANINGMAEIDVSDSEAEEAEHHGHKAFEDNEEDEDVGEEDLTDPFESHFASPDPNALSEGVKAVKDQRWELQSTSTSQGVKQQCSLPDTAIVVAHDGSRNRHFESFKLKRRLAASGETVWNRLETIERGIASAVFAYKDILFGSRTIDNAPRLRDLIVLHALNHVFKTRDRVIKNNSKLSQDDQGNTFDLRDQGFTRPKILIILPTRQACVRFIDSMVKLCQPEQQENKSRFVEGFVQNEDTTWDDKPRDFQELFGGNDDDMFRIGLKFTRKTIKFFSAFYNSDIILASPLGLRTAIEKGSSKDGKKGNDADFLSSIEIAIVDQASALLMQNWQHVEYIFSQLNLLPKESHGCDFSRVRHWCLDGKAKYLRQTIVLADFITPEINSIHTKLMLNIAGKLKYTPVYSGAILAISSSLPLRIPQLFLRLNAPTPSSCSDIRFSHFTSSILPPLLKPKQQQSGTLIFTSSYPDFLRLQNHLATSPTTASLSFAAISEYTSVRDVARARSHFLSGRQSVLLYSERAHHFRRYAIQGVQRVVFYSLPENPLFWGEVVVGMLGDDGLGKQRDSRRGARDVRALFSRWDVLKLERIVGTERVRRMVCERGGGGDVFEFT